MAGNVMWSPEGLAFGILDKRYQFVIDVRAAGKGELKAECKGPTSAAMCRFTEESKNGVFVLELIPREIGDHHLQVTYDGAHVPRSPLSFNVYKYEPSATNIKVYGEGIGHGVLKTSGRSYDSSFVCDLAGAGQGALNVRVGGPRGSFKVQMSREGRQVICKYDPRLPGEYTIDVMWSGDHVPGSPFHVQLFRRQKDLEIFLENNYPDVQPLI